MSSTVKIDSEPACFLPPPQPPLQTTASVPWLTALSSVLPPAPLPLLQPILSTGPSFAQDSAMAYFLGVRVLTAAFEALPVRKSNPRACSYSDTPAALVLHLRTCCARNTRAPDTVLPQWFTQMSPRSTPWPIFACVSP